MNVLVYSGAGTSVDCVKYCTQTLRRIFSPYYSVVPVNSKTLADEPWAQSSSLVVIPGGADLAYCRELGGRANEAIASFVRKGGCYVGFCAGGYYGSAHVEFEVGDLDLEVSGPRELCFFPGICRGGAFAGFQYSMDGATASARKLVLDRKILGTSDEENRVPESLHTYYDGGGMFVDADKFGSDVEILADYADPVDVASSDSSEPDNGSGRQAAVIRCKVGRGSALLLGTHPEFPASAMNVRNFPGKASDREALQADEDGCIWFLQAAFRSMGLRVSDRLDQPPALTRLTLSSVRPGPVQELYSLLLVEIGFKGEHQNLLVGSNDTFRLFDSSQGSPLMNPDASQFDPEDGTIDYNKAVKEVDLYFEGYPPPKVTPNFSHELYYNELRNRDQDCGDADSESEMGAVLLYGEVVSSTSTMLDHNYNILKHLPQGLAALGTVQLAGRGRGNNVWINAGGGLSSSMVLRLKVSSEYTSPIVFVQYLVSLAMLEAIRGYGPGYQNMPIRLKWPNDIYVFSPQADDAHPDDEAHYTKIGGVIVTSTYVRGEFVLVFGLGVNVFNPLPTTSVNSVLHWYNNRNNTTLPDYKIEVLLAKFMKVFERMWRTFVVQGFAPFEDLYYRRWLHTGRLVTLEQYNTRAVIRGISIETGLLLVDEVNSENRMTGKRVELLPDGNSFDMFRGLLKKKT